ncbi:PRKR-interacting protein 1 homolog [Corticium candelabrum]|uniref:PRKR-interacting protein 1 homolog n=1 Tax=Corticium candelabrum TaxID=121492 RepID=UPI002E269E3A|nr:PRKR-interacting protein 1 homolog [Corticium candelabrum]
MDDNRQKREAVVAAPRRTTDEQRLKIERMMADPEKPVVIPEPKKLRAPRPPPEFNFDVMGSSAGAGSGEFHIYRGIRRREQNRVKWIETQAANEDMDEEFQLRLGKKKLEDNERTAKKRAKRAKKKEKTNASKKQKQKEMKQHHTNDSENHEDRSEDEEQSQST